MGITQMLKTKLTRTSVQIICFLGFSLLLYQVVPRRLPTQARDAETSLTSVAAADIATSAAAADIAIIDTDYPVPQDALFVAPNGDDQSQGSQAAPLRTIQAAIDRAASGTTIVIRAGTYRESAILRGKQLTLQPYPHEAVWMRGSVVVDDWAAEGALWRKDSWQPKFRPQRGHGDPDHPLAGFPDMLFIDNRPLAQVDRKSKVGPGRFFVDLGRSALYLGDDPHGKTIAATMFAQALVLEHASGTIVRGLGFAHYGAPPQNGAVRGQSDSSKLLFEHNVFVWNASAGLSMLGGDGVVRGNIFAYNGQLGFHGYKTHGLLLEQNSLLANNQEHFSMNWEAGGVKITAARDMIWRDNIAERNAGTGLWCDISCYNTTIVRNVVRNNDHHGIMYEISANALIASNVVAENQGFGIFVIESEMIDVYNNTLSRNQQNIRISEQNRKLVPGSLVSRDVHNITIRNNILSDSQNARGALLGVDDTRNRKSAHQMGVRSDYNAYYRSNALSSGPLIAWARGASDTHFTSLDAFSSSTGMEAHGLHIEAAANPFFINERGGNYRLRDGSPAIGRGEPLPQAVADAIGVTAGGPVNLGAIKWPSEQHIGHKQ
jgi:parallel beta-helix repeat protein